MTMRIIGTGSALPEARITNDNLAEIMDTSDEWIQGRTGIRARRIAITETTTSMSIDAAREALKDAGVMAEDIELIIVATLSPDMCLPSTACEVQSAIGAVNATAFDLNAACSGFLFALNTAYAYLQCGIYKTALIIGAETLSKMMDWQDRSTCVLFGDGAGAVVVKNDNVGMIGMKQGSDGSRGMVLSCENRRVNNPYVTNDMGLSYVKMDGQEVYRFAVKTVPKCMEDMLDETHISADRVKYYLLHQANLRIIESVSKRLNQPIEKFPTNLEECGNISAGSVPILLDHVNKKGELKRGDIIVLAGFGAGLTWGAAVLEW